MGGMMIVGKLIKSIILGTLLFVILSLGSNAYASSYGVVADEDRLNVRTGPGTEYSVITSLPFGARVCLGEENNGWVFIDYDNSIRGWCAANRIAEYEVILCRGYINAPNSNKRTGPSSNTRLMRTFGYGEPLKVLGHTSLGWYYVAGGDTEDNGWVYDEYVTLKQ